MMCLGGSAAVVTGASYGIGRAAAVVLAQEGADLILAARNENELPATAELVRETGGEAVVCATDISCRDQVDNLLGPFWKEFGRVDLLINNAGGWGGAYHHFIDCLADGAPLDQHYPGRPKCHGRNFPVL